ncbi:MAG: hypothetical protein IJD60_08150 [Clostridia bacterium]|nr:hypothetical protein [Clostridia bacterium]
MTRLWVMLMLVLSLLVFAAESVYAMELDAPELQAPLAALKVSMPEAQVNYAIKTRDDGRESWELFFKQNNALGVCKIPVDSNTIRKVELYDRGTEDALTADLAMEKLRKEKGEMTVLDLELDWDDGRLYYEGEAKVGDRRYEFEMTADGRIIEWERD